MKTWMWRFSRSYRSEGRRSGVTAMFDAAIARGEGALDAAAAARVPNSQAP